MVDNSLTGTFIEPPLSSRRRAGLYAMMLPTCLSVCYFVFLFVCMFDPCRVSGCHATRQYHQRTVSLIFPSLEKLFVKFIVAGEFKRAIFVLQRSNPQHILEPTVS